MCPWRIKASCLLTNAIGVQLQVPCSAIIKLRPLLMQPIDFAMVEPASSQFPVRGPRWESQAEWLKLNTKF